MTSRTALTMERTLDLTLFGSGPASNSPVPHPFLARKRCSWRMATAFSTSSPDM
eukprot:CAMPEP_0180139314 /NCGR_PEP_ID=MMETSP0986-20121125/13458_1 /TAXON_ID=697907 /ORGANISM="non described non described, Strain CCMP2293" /LENGTH=53 /DNA_ID=CAMNT_0022081391 /DNA_START=367 /DNA_END=528 /DNA_ORIENTATION=-